MRIRDPVPFYPWIRDTGSGMGKKSGSGSEMNNRDHISESLETIFWVKILKFFDVGPGSGGGEALVSVEPGKCSWRGLALIPQLVI